MPNIRDIKRRINGVKSTEQITRAMKLVASSKVQKAKQNVEINRFYFESMKAAVKNAMHTNEKIDSQYIRASKDGAKKVLYIVLSSDRGLCGGYNINLFKEMASNLKAENKNIFAISGRKAKEYCHRKDLEIVFEVNGISENPTYEDAKEFGRLAIDKYRSGEVDEVYLVYTKFKTIINQEQEVFKILPFDDTQGESEEDNKKEIMPLKIYEPGVTAVLDYVVPKYINSVIYGGMLEAAASEEGSRMTAMDSATNNAVEIVGDLTLTYNRVRQSSITTEISEIVGGANALNA